MALQISEKNGIYNVIGKINTQTVGDFKIHFLDSIHKCNPFRVKIKNPIGLK